MSFLVGSRREAQPLDLLRSLQQDGVEDVLSSLFDPELVSRTMRPRDELAEFIYGMTQLPESAVFIEWLMDITLRAPMSVTGPTIEATALNAARREGAAMIGEAVLAAIARGHKSLAARSGART